MSSIKTISNISGYTKNGIKGFFKNLFLNNRFFYALFFCVVLFVFGYIFEALFPIAKLCFFILALALFTDVFLLFYGEKLMKLNRATPEKLSNGDQNSIKVRVVNKYGFNIDCTLIEELPVQFQQRDFLLKKALKSNEDYSFQYTVKPVERGEYHFGHSLLFVSTKLGFASRRFVFENEQMLKTYPSYIQLKKFDFISFNTNTMEFGLKKIRRIGTSFEFEQIKEYVQGDNIKEINWKATAKRNQLMVNQFQDEKSQRVYSIIDKGRVMKMPFEGLSLLDYAINASLVISSVVLRKHDKAGIFSFSKKTENYVAAERRNSQMNLILESLYNVNTDFSESDFGALYASVKRNITHRSLLILYTNFESIDAVHRQMNYLRAINRTHLLVVVFFKNTKLNVLRSIKATNMQDIFDKTIAQKFSHDKKLIVSELNKYGIQTILTSPEKLSIDTINKYLEVKAKGIL